MSIVVLSRIYVLLSILVELSAPLDVRVAGWRNGYTEGEWPTPGKLGLELRLAGPNDAHSASCFTALLFIFLLACVSQYILLFCQGRPSRW